MDKANTKKRAVAIRKSRGNYYYIQKGRRTIKDVLQTFDPYDEKVKKALGIESNSMIQPGYFAGMKNDLLISLTRSKRTFSAAWVYPLECVLTIHGVKTKVTEGY